MQTLKLSNRFLAIFLAILAAIGVFGGHHAHAAGLSDRIKVTVSGKGPDVVLIPGLASSAWPRPAPSGTPPSSRSRPRTASMSFRWRASPALRSPALSKGPSLNRWPKLSTPISRPII